MISMISTITLINKIIARSKTDASTAEARTHVDLCLVECPAPSLMPHYSLSEVTEMK